MGPLAKPGFSEAGDTRAGMALTHARDTTIGADMAESGLGFGADLDLLAGRLEALGADLQVDPGLFDRLEGVLQSEVAVFQEFQLLVLLLQGLLVCQLFVHGSTSSTRAPTRPVASRMRSLRSTAVSAAERMTTPDSASWVML